MAEAGEVFLGEGDNEVYTLRWRGMDGHVAESALLMFWLAVNTAILS